MTDLRDMLKVMTDFQDGILSPAAFTEHYTELWKNMVNEQDEAIKQQPTVSRMLDELREMNQNGEITPDRYSQRVQEQYALLQGISIRPGSKVSDILDHVFVVVDAYREDVDEAAPPYITAEALHETVHEAVKDLEAG